MLTREKKITIELEKSDVKETKKEVLTNPITDKLTNEDKISMMVLKVIEEEFPHLKNNSLLFDLVTYSIMEKMNTVQSVENVLSYIKGAGAKEVRDVTFKNGEVLIKCST